MPDNSEPGPEELALLGHLIKFVEEHGFQPTIDELARDLQTKSQQIRKWLHGLVKCGHLGLIRERAMVLRHVKFRAFSNCYGKRREKAIGSPPTTTAMGLATRTSGKQRRSLTVRFFGAGLVLS